jgi:hypothetical protein
LYNTGTLRARLVFQWDGGWNDHWSFNGLSLNTPYRVEIKFDANTDTWAWRLDGVNQPNNMDNSDPVTSEGTMVAGRPIDGNRLYLGHPGWGPESYTVCMDRMAIDTASWPADSGGGNGSGVNTTGTNLTEVNMTVSANRNDIDFRFSYPLSASKGTARTDVSQFQVRSPVPLAAIHQNITYLAQQIRDNDPYWLGPDCGLYMANEITVLNDTIIRFAVNISENEQFAYRFAFDTTVFGSCYQ